MASTAVHIEAWTHTVASAFLLTETALLSEMECAGIESTLYFCAVSPRTHRLAHDEAAT
jgi:hypothetical protein